MREQILSGIFGYDIKYSLSPAIQNTMSRLAGINLCYGRFDVPPEKFTVAFNGFKALKIKGANITQPYKVNVLGHVDRLSGDAELIGSVNTVNLEEDGNYSGYNTDVIGFIKAVKYEFKEGLKDKKITVLGAGGASRAIIYALIKESAKSVLIINRNMEKAMMLKKDAEIWKKVLQSGSTVLCSGFNLDDALSRAVLENSDIIVNTVTPSSESGELIKRFFLENLSDKKSLPLLMDISYSAEAARLLNGIRKKTLMSVNGLSMLFFQAIESFYIWTGERIDFNVLKEALPV